MQIVVIVVIVVLFFPTRIVSPIKVNVLFSVHPKHAVKLRVRGASIKKILN